MKDILFVVGTRPELIKIRSVLLEIVRRGWAYRLIHSGQHYDYNMSEIFFEELGLPYPHEFLEIKSRQQGSQTAEGLRKFEALLIDKPPNLVVVHGDTNTTLFGALAAIKQGIPVAHLEAGVRSFDMTMPEEINRRIVDSISTYCFAPTKRAVSNLKNEGKIDNVIFVGDTLVETAKEIRDMALTQSKILTNLKLKSKQFGLVTSHRKENVDSMQNAKQISEALLRLDLPLVYPMHPRTKKNYINFGIFEKLKDQLIISDPIGYFDFITLINHAKLILTDSGGVQQEASIFNIPCLTLRQNTEWVETIETGKNKLVGVETEKIVNVANEILNNSKVYQKMVDAPSPFKKGASKRILDYLEKIFSTGTLKLPSSNFLKEGIPF